jgi:hypothetical protein
MKKSIGAVAVLLILAGCGTPAAGQSEPVSSPSVAQPTPASTTDQPSPAQPSETAVPQTFTMPDLVGKNLQDAQDALQALGSYLLDQQDASGKSRLQVDDSNWQVCTQEPAAGQEVSVAATVALASVKLDEQCPGSAPAASGEATAQLTVSQQQAVNKAQEYLDFTAFSKSGLVKQLKYEGFSDKDAKFAVNHIKVDWNEQAARKAQDYLDLTSFSRSGLVKQLKFEGFTQKQAEYGAKAVGL